MKKIEARLEGVAVKAAARYAKRVFWADPNDLRQEARIAALEVQKPGRFDPQCGVPLEAYAWRACMLHLRAWCWRNSSPLSETDHHLQDLAGIHRADLVKAAHVPLDTPAADDLLDAKRRQEQVAAQIDYLLARSGNPAVVRSVLLEDKAPEEVAREHDLPLVRVYQLARRARILLSENAVLYSLWKDET